MLGPRQRARAKRRPNLTSFESSSYPLSLFTYIDLSVGILTEVAKKERVENVEDFPS